MSGKNFEIQKTKENPIRIIKVTSKAVKLKKIREET